MRERGLKQHFGAPVESTDEFNNAAYVFWCNDARYDVIDNKLASCGG